MAASLERDTVDLPGKYRTQVRQFTDIVARTLTLNPYPNPNVTSSNASQTMTFTVPQANFLDISSRPLTLEFTLKIPSCSGDRPGPFLGHLFQTIRVFINNCLVSEVLNAGFMNSLYQHATKSLNRQTSVEADIQGNGFLTDFLAGDQTVNPIQTAFNTVASAAGIDYPVYKNVTKAQWDTLLDATGVVYRVPIHLPDGLLNQKKGLIPSFCAPSMRIEFTFNPSSYVLFTQQPTASNVAYAAPHDYQLSNFHIDADFVQSESLARIYKSEKDYECSYVERAYFSVPISGTTNGNLGISAPYKSMRDLFGVVANMAQFSGADPGKDVSCHIHSHDDGRLHHHR